MQQLLDPRSTISIKLPSFPDVEVVMYEGLLMHQIRQITKVTEDYLAGLETIKMLIKSWDFVDENNNPLPVTEDSLGRLPSIDFGALMEVANKSIESMELKKKKN